MGERDLRSVMLSEREQTSLAVAARILGDLRERVEDGRADCDETTDIALAAHTCRDLSITGRVDIP